MEKSSGDFLVLSLLLFAISFAILYILMKAAMRVVLKEREVDNFLNQSDEKKHLEHLLKTEKISKQEYDHRMLQLPTLIVYGKW